MSPIERQVSEILNGPLGRDDKIARLRQLESDTHALARASGEGMPPADGANPGADLKLIELALAKFGIAGKDKGAATL